MESQLATHDAPLWAASIVVPALLSIGALAARRSRPLWSAKLATTAAAVLALALISVRGIAAFLHPLTDSLVLGGFIRVDMVACLMLALVTSLGWVVARYSERYLAGEPGLLRYERSLLTTLAGASLLVLSNHFGLLVISWFMVSISLHQLLTFYPQRPAAIVAAHKKFILSRLADGLLVLGSGLIGNSVGSFFISDALDLARASAPMSLSVQIGMVLVVGSVILKSAQLPFHGWMTQVMEAPTPVSALLHAGVVNLGGYVLIQLAPLLMRATLAQGVLLAFGLTTAAIASLTMMTRVSIKVALAWSTIAQMGFMLVQCALGAWHFALLHLLAHSAYKAHAFLNAGTTVQSWLNVGAPARPTTRMLTRAASLVAITWVLLGASLLMLNPALMTAELVASSVILAIGVTPTVALALSWGRAGTWSALKPVALVAGALAGLHWLAGLSNPDAPSFAFGWAVTLGTFALVFVLQRTLQHHSDSRLAQWLRPRLFNAFSLDEWFTRLTFAVWPPHQPMAPTTTRVHEQSEVRS